MEQQQQQQQLSSQKLHDVRQALTDALGHHPDEDNLPLVLQNIMEKADGLAAFPASPSCRGSLMLAGLCFMYCSLSQPTQPLHSKAADALLTVLHSFFLQQFFEKTAAGEEVFCEAGDSRLFAFKAVSPPVIRGVCFVASHRFVVW